MQVLPAVKKWFNLHFISPKSLPNTLFDGWNVHVACGAGANALVAQKRRLPATWTEVVCKQRKSRAHTWSERTAHTSEREFAVISGFGTFCTHLLGMWAQTERSLNCRLQKVVLPKNWKFTHFFYWLRWNVGWLCRVYNKHTSSQGWQSKCMNSNHKHELVCPCAATYLHWGEKKPNAVHCKLCSRSWYLVGSKWGRGFAAFRQTGDVVRSVRAVNRAQEVTAFLLKVYFSTHWALKE